MNAPQPLTWLIFQMATIPSLPRDWTSGTSRNKPILDGWLVDGEPGLVEAVGDHCIRLRPPFLPGPFVVQEHRVEGPIPGVGPMTWLLPGRLALEQHLPPMTQPVAPCIPEAEICDGLDNDCNGLTDDGLLPRPCFQENVAGQCEGTEECQGTLGWVCDAPAPSDETCDSFDNDCDGETDEGCLAAFACQLDQDCVAVIPGAVVSCSNGICLLWGCQDSYLDCDEWPGCESYRLDATTCGSCELQCPEGKICSWNANQGYFCEDPV